MDKLKKDNDSSIELSHELELGALLTVGALSDVLSHMPESLPVFIQEKGQRINVLGLLVMVTTESNSDNIITFDANWTGVILQSEQPSHHTDSCPEATTPNSNPVRDHV